MSARFLKTMYYKNSQKVRRKALVMRGTPVMFHGVEALVLGFADTNGYIHIGAVNPVSNIPHVATAHFKELGLEQE